MNLQSKLGKVFYDSGTDPVWVVSQLEFELIRFENALLQYRHDDRSISEADILRRFDILWSRRATLDQGTTKKILDSFKGAPEILAQVASELVALDPLVQNIGQLDGSQINEKLQGLNRTVHDLSLLVLKTKSADSAKLRSSLLESSRQIFFFTVVTALSSTLLTVLIWMESRRHRTISEENRTLLWQSHMALEEKSQFVSVVSHELRTPLTSIKGSLALVRAGLVGEATDNLARMIDIAYNNSSRLAVLIDDLLDLEKAEAGKMEYDFQSIDLIELVKESVDSNQPYADTYDITFRLIGELNPVSIMGDYNRLLQVMANVLSNAAKFSHKGSFVDIGVELSDERVRVSVRDYGIGIPADARKKVFEKFAQVDSSDRRQTGGTGLGMSIARSILESHDGTIDFTCGPEKGTTFQIDFNIAPVRAVMAAQ